MTQEVVLTNHASNDRQSRLKLCESLDEGAVIVKEFHWDKGHVDGPEIHKISSNGIIWIYNELTGRFITALIARPGQIRRYYEMDGEVPPKELVDKALRNQQLGYNNM